MDLSNSVTYIEGQTKVHIKIIKVKVKTFMLEKLYILNTICSFELDMVHDKKSITFFVCLFVCFLLEHQISIL